MSNFTEKEIQQIKTSIVGLVICFTLLGFYIAYEKEIFLWIQK